MPVVIIWKQFPVYLSTAPLHPKFSVLSHCPACTATGTKIATKYSCNNKSLKVISEIQEPNPQLVQISADQFTALERHQFFTGWRFVPECAFCKRNREKVVGKGWEGKHPIFFWGGCWLKCQPWVCYLLNPGDTVCWVKLTSVLQLSFTSLKACPSYLPKCLHKIRF